MIKKNLDHEKWFTQNLVIVLFFEQKLEDNKIKINTEVFGLTPPPSSKFLLLTGGGGGGGVGGGGG